MNDASVLLVQPVRILSVGCGMRKAEPGIIRLDKAIDVHPDVVWDLEEFPYPFRDQSFSEIECFDVIEHLTDIPLTMEEFHRLLKPQGLLKITTPHFSCANTFIDPTHKHHLSYFSFDFFCADHKLAYYSKARYRIHHRRIWFKGMRLLKAVIGRIANRFPEVYEQRWAMMFPAFFLYFELEALQ